MKRTLTVLAIAALAAVVPAHASIYGVSFTGTVYQSTGNTGQAVGNTVNGHFDLDSTTGNFVDYTIAGQSIPSGFLSSALFSIGNFDAEYTAQISPVSLGTSTASSFTLDLSSLTSWPGSDTVYSLLTDTNQLTTNLDTASNPLSAFPSTFDYYTANSNGTNVTSLFANLNTLAVTVVTPEPASFALFASALLVLGLFARLRRA